MWLKLIGMLNPGIAGALALALIVGGFSGGVWLANTIASADRHASIEKAQQAEIAAKQRVIRLEREQRDGADAIEAAHRVQIDQIKGAADARHKADVSYFKAHPGSNIAIPGDVVRLWNLPAGADPDLPATGEPASQPDGDSATCRASDLLEHSRTVAAQLAACRQTVADWVKFYAEQQAIVNR